jgi:excisionase family DNA binding protein
MEALPTQQDSEFALAALKQLSAIVKRNGRGPRRIQLNPEGGKETVTIVLPQDALRGFLEILAQMANGNAVTIVPVHAEFTTQQAADYLNVSRPFLISLLEDKKIPFRTVGSHRRIRFIDLKDYREADDQQRERVLAELAEDAQKNNHGY